MTPQKLTLEPFTAGDTWRGIPSITVTVNGVPPVSPLTAVRMRFALVDSAAATVVEISLSGSKITITNAANWIFVVPPQAMPGLTVGRWKWHLETTDAAGTITTYLVGDQLVLSDL